MKTITRIIPVLFVTLGLTLGCGNKGNDSETKPAAKLKPVTTDTLQTPESVWVYGGSQPVGPTLDTVTGFAQKVVPGAPPLRQMIGPLSSSNFGIKKPDFLALSKPIRFAFFAPGADGKERVAILLPIQDVKTFSTLVLDKNKAEKIGKNALSYTPTPGGPKAYVNYVGDYGVFTTHAEVFAKEKTFIENLGRATMPISASAYIELAHIMKAMGKDFDGALAAAKAEMRRTMMGPARSQLVIINKMIDGVGNLAREIDRIRLGISAAPDGLQMDVRIAAIDKSALAKGISKLTGNGHKLMTRMPADAPFFGSVSMNAELWGAWGESWSADFVIKPIFGDQPKGKTYLAAISDLVKEMTGDVAFTAHGAPGGQGLSLSTIFGVKNGAAVNTAQDTLWKMYDQPEMQAYNTRNGLKMEFGAPTPFAGTTIRENRITLTNMAANPMAALMGDIGLQYIAVGKDLGVMAYGPDGKTVVEGFLKGTYKGLDQVSAAKRALAKGAKNAFAFAYVSPLALAQRVHLGGMNPVAAALNGLPATSGLTFSAGVTEGDLQFVIDLPREFATEAFGAFQQIKGSL